MPVALTRLANVTLGRSSIFHLRALLEAGVDDAHKAVQKQESKPTIGRRWKLPVAFVGLMLTTVGALGSLAWIAPTDQSPLTGASVPIQRLWQIAILGGAVGGLARALYSFLLDNYAFHYRQITERSSPWAKTVYGIKDDSEMEDDYDPLESWHLYFIKPFLGATLGLLFAVGVDLGLLGLGGTADGDKRFMRLVVTAGLAGLFADNALQRLKVFVTKDGE
jgi:hypothetical protein